MTYGFSLAASAAVWIASLTIQNNNTDERLMTDQRYHQAIGALAMIICLICEMVSFHPKVELQGLVMADMGRRIMKLTVIILGQSLLAVVLPGNIYENPVFTYLTVSAVLLLAFLFKTLHFDFDEGHKATDWAR